MCKPASKEAIEWLNSLNFLQQLVVGMLMKEVTGMGMCKDCALNWVFREIMEWETENATIH
jgi:hypothetical protein